MLLTAAVVLMNSAAGQTRSFGEHEKTSLFKQQRSVNSSASGWFDAIYYRLELTFTTNPNYLSGVVTAQGTCRQNNSQILSLDLAGVMHVDSVRVNGAACSFFRRTNSFDITLARPYQSGEMISAEIFYGGIPAASGLGSFLFTNHNGAPWIYTLSEPYGASDWWPCKNMVDDKADSADIIVTCNSYLKAGSNGILISSVLNGNGTITYHWKERYPIAPYLVSVALTNYLQFSNWFRYSATDSMEVLNYVLPEHYAIAQQELPKTIDMLTIYTGLFGPYPFLKEKYGHAEFGSGGMEHQTMTSLGTYTEDVIAHELAHQWFGDMITCRTWSDLWLNEGFAEYSTGLYREKRYGAASFREYMTPLMNTALTAPGTIGAPDTTNPSKLFNFALMYAKGASVLHMLRYVTGDSLFFLAMRAYADAPALRYSSASTRDLQQVFETVNKGSLDYFFDEWIYGTGVPTYYFTWRQSTFGTQPAVIIMLQQPSGKNDPGFFTMPVEFRITTAAGDTTVRLFNDQREQIFAIPLSAPVTAVVLDPNSRMLKKVIIGNDVPPYTYILAQNYPNPFNGETKILYMLPNRTDVTLTVYDMLGREVTTLVNERQMPGVYEVPWNAHNIASGMYIYRLTAGEMRLQRRMVVVR
ncbi:MAG: M1 family aminopeptidase [Bacteroidota bacterium]